jgi:hypothetical protein
VTRIFVVLFLLAALAGHVHAAVDNAICSTADQVGCTTANLRTNANEELPALSQRAPLLLAGVTGINAITACATPAITSYVDGQSAHVKFATNNTGVMTINLCGVGALPLNDVSGAALASGAVQSAPLYFIRYYAAGAQWRILNSTVTAPTFVTKIAGDTGNAGTFSTTQLLTADAAANSTTTLATVMSSTVSSPGTYAFKYMVRYESAAVTTGVALAVNFTGAHSSFQSVWSYPAGTAVSGIADQNSETIAGHLMEAKGARVANTLPSTTAGVDTANASMLAIVEGVVVATAAGTFELRVASEVAASAVTVKSGTLLMLNKVN